MRHTALVLLTALSGVAGCTRSDPDTAALNALSQQQAQAMVGKEYVFVAPTWICREPAHVYVPESDSGCRFGLANRFTVEETVLARNDGRPILRIAGPGIAGYIAYGAALPKPYREAQSYFGTQKGP